MRESKVISTRNTRVYDFPELQVGFPERNDVSDPNMEMEGVDVDLETSGRPPKSAEAISRKIRGAKAPRMVKR